MSGIASRYEVAVVIAWALHQVFISIAIYPHVHHIGIEWGLDLKEILPKASGQRFSYFGPRRLGELDPRSVLLLLSLDILSHNTHSLYVPVQ